MRYRWQNPSLLILNSLQPWWLNGKLNGFMKDIHGSKKTPKRPQCRQYSLHLIYFFYWEDNCKFQLINGTITGRSSWRSLTIFGCSKSCLDWKVLNARTVKAERGGGRISEREERKGGNDYFNLVFTYVIFNMRDVAISPKYNFEKLLRKLTISDFYWLKTYRVWCIVLLMANPLKCLDEWTIKACAHSKKDVWPRNSFRWIK